MERRRQRKEYPASFMSDDLIGLWESNGSQPITAEQPGGFWGMSWYSPPSEQHAEYGWFGWGDGAATHASESVGPTYDAAEMGGVQGFFGSPLRTLLAREVNMDQSADLSADGAMYCDTMLRCYLTPQPSFDPSTGSGPQDRLSPLGRRGGAGQSMVAR